ncbi:MAG: hypothetical protein DBX60_03085 [Bacillota bacterium]|nr:MAG: hypothetical protein DBX60_03085 [Bacillota bacterium]
MSCSWGWGAWEQFWTEREMLWLKVLVAALTIAFSVALGYFLAEKYRARKRFFAEFCRFNERYLAELSYERRPLGSFLKEGAYEGDFGKAVAAFSASRQAELSFPFLTKEERVDGENYFRQLGKGDSHTQTAYFSAQKARLSACKEQCEREAKARTELYTKLGLLAGLALVVLIM